MNSLRQRLKLETTAVHQQLHRLSVSEKLVAGEISIAEYAQYLEAHRYFYQTLDRHFCEDKSGLIAHSECFVDWLEYDLNHVGTTFTRLNNSSVYDSFCSAVDRSLAAELGYAYVKYGSMFGAGVILRVLRKKHLNRDREGQVLAIPSTVYLSNAMAKQKLFWERFESALCDYHEDDDRVVQSAIKSFEVVFGLLTEQTVITPKKSRRDRIATVI